ncbi:MAG TPA: hypothetical protein VI386_08520 [Candidatus Sulfotelmatobacter sp.]
MKTFAWVTGILLLAALASAQEEDYSKTEIKVTKAAKILEAWKKFSGDFVTQDIFIDTLYNSLTGKKTGELIKPN